MFTPAYRCATAYRVISGRPRILGTPIDRAYLFVKKRITITGHLRFPTILGLRRTDDHATTLGITPPLTTVRIPEYEIGRRAAQLLRSRIDDPTQKAETVLIAPELIVRGSTAAPRVRRAG